MQNNQKIIILAFLIISAVLIAGCTSYSPKILPQAELHVQSTSSQSWSLGLGCYWKVSGYIYNSGNAAASNAIITVKLIDSSTNSIRDSKNIDIGLVDTGSSQNFETTLDGDCNRNYGIKVEIR